MQGDEDLKHSIQMKFGTHPGEPTDWQLSQIRTRLRDISSRGRDPTDQEWILIVYECCPSAGSCSYHGIDNSDLRTMLRIAKGGSK